MPYKGNKPEATDKLRISQADIQQNFQGILNSWIINHVTFDNADHGKHNEVRFPQQVAAPVSGATEASLFVLDSPDIPGTPGLNVNIAAGATNYDFTTCLPNMPGWCRLPCGILLKWDLVAVNAGLTNTINFNATNPNFLTRIFLAIPTLQAGSHEFIAADAIAPLGTVRINNYGTTNIGCYVLAMGI